MGNAKQTTKGRIYYSGSLVSKCSIRISDAIGYKVRFTEKPNGTVSVFDCQPSDNFVRFQDGKENWRLWNIKISNIWPSWIGIRLRFEFENYKHALKSICALLAIDIDGLCPLYRAEWDYDSFNDQTSNHAQPHWHALVHNPQFHPTFKEDNFFEEQAITEFCPQGSNDPVDASKIHLAMSAHWHTSSDADFKHNLKSDEELLSWLESLTKYLISQLVYLKKKEAVPVIKEFT